MHPVPEDGFLHFILSSSSSSFVQSDLYNYNPQPVDMTNLTLSREMQNMAERLAENAHDIWAKRKKEELEACGEYMA